MSTSLNSINASSLPEFRWGRIVRLIVGGAALAAAAAFVASGGRWTLALIGMLMGLALYHAAFGFSHGFRVLFREGRSAHVRAQIIMLGLAVALFFPALAAGDVFGAPVRGLVFPVGLGVAVGAFLFGVGMQISGGCISGTLYTAGGGSLRMLLTLVFAIVGATAASMTYPMWSEWPALPAYSILAEAGLSAALTLHVVVFALVYWLVVRRERLRHGVVEPIFGGSGTVSGKSRFRALLRGPWPYAWAAIALAFLNFATLVAIGRPWGVTQAFALWGAKAAEASGLSDPAFWAFWEDPNRVEMLMRPLAADATTVMNIGVVAGALAAALLAGRFATALKVSPGAAAGSIVGGLLIGYGAIVATGCNISAFFSGIASGSLHGWVWIAAALPGNWLGLKLRPIFGLDERPA